LFMNFWAANHDESKFPEPMEFRPERWLTPSIGSNKVQVLDTNVNHFAFGIGCRKCLGSSFATRELYILFAKMILRFRPIRSNSMKTATSDFPPSNPLELNMFPESLAIEPRSFDIVLEGRDCLQNDVLGI
jgi:phenylacetate 2-hydroxylase